MYDQFPLHDILFRYPAILKTLLQNGNGLWSRLWIVLIKLLKNQVTQPLGAIGSPINSMLPVVENAFKMDVDNRCKAFECWSVLMESFAIEINETNMSKRIKLLLIPLKSNNAKVENCALVKFNCWYTLLLRFQMNLDKYLDNILISFLQFCFGKYNVTDRNTLVPGLISTEVTKKCVQAMVEMVGHVKCNGCTDLPKLEEKAITTKHLVDNWSQWIYSLTKTVMVTVNSESGLTTQQISCLWKSFLVTIGDLPENNIRKDLYIDMLSILSNIVEVNYCSCIMYFVKAQSCQSNG